MKTIAKTNCKACFVSHLGAWAIIPHVLEHALAEYVDGRMTVAFEAGAEIPDSVSTEVVDRTAIISIGGTMTKGRSKFGGSVSTLDAREHVRAASRNDAVDAVLLRIDSPGGHVSGTAELGADIDRLARMKPTHVFGEDTLASAAYWIASGASRITANDMATVGSIGVFAVMMDQSRQFDKRGITVHKLATGDLKGAGVPGTAITEEALAEYGGIVQHYGEQFFSRVRSQRVLTDENWQQISRGGVFTAPQAKAVGLIDEIGSLEDAFSAAREAGQKFRGRQRLKAGL